MLTCWMEEAGTEVGLGIEKGLELPETEDEDELDIAGGQRKVEDWIEDWPDTV